MSHFISLNLLCQICVFTNLIVGDKFIGKYFHNKVKNNLASNGSNHKLWMEYLEKRLEKISMHAGMQTLRKRKIFSIVQLQREFLKRVDTSCVNQYIKLQIGIVGSICALSKHAVHDAPDKCSHLKEKHNRLTCKFLLAGERKYFVMHEGHIYKGLSTQCFTLNCNFYFA